MSHLKITNRTLRRLASIFVALHVLTFVSGCQPEKAKEEAPPPSPPPAAFDLCDGSDEVRLRIERRPSQGYKTASSLEVRGDCTFSYEERATVMGEKNGIYRNFVGSVLPEKAIEMAADLALLTPKLIREMKKLEPVVSFQDRHYKIEVVETPLEKEVGEGSRYILTLKRKGSRPTRLDGPLRRRLTKCLSVAQFERTKEQVQLDISMDSEGLISSVRGRRISPKLKTCFEEGVKSFERFLLSQPEPERASFNIDMRRIRKTFPR